MARRQAPARTPVDVVMDSPEATLLDALDELLDKGAAVDGDLTLGVAGVDLIYLRLSAVLGAADRLLPVERRRPGSRRRKGSRRLRSR